MKIQLPFGRTVDTDVEPPEETEEVKKAREEAEKNSSDPGKAGSLTNVLLGYGVLATAKELFPQEKLDAAAELLADLKKYAENWEKFTVPPEDPVYRLYYHATLLRNVLRRLSEYRDAGDTASQELITQIILPDLRDEIRDELRYTIDPTAKARDEKACTCDEHSECASCPPDGEDEEKANPVDDGYTYAPGEVPRFIFDIYRDDEIGWCFIIEPVKHWQAKHCVSDCYSREERDALEPILEKAGLVETMESTYELADPDAPDASGAIQVLEAAGLKQDAAFTKFLEEHRG